MLARLASGYNSWSMAVGSDGCAGRWREELFWLAQGSIATGRPAAVCRSAVMVDQPGVGTAAAGE
jgi:hypothetical protein